MFFMTCKENCFGIPMFIFIRIFKFFCSHYTIHGVLKIEQFIYAKETSNARRIYNRGAVKIFLKCLNKKTVFVNFWSVYQSFLYWIFMFQIAHFQKILEG